MENNLTELPNRWQIKVTKENQNMVKDFFIKQTTKPSGRGSWLVWFFSIGYIYGFKDYYYFNGDKSFPFLTDEQFKKWVLKDTIYEVIDNHFIGVKSGTTINSINGEDKFKPSTKEAFDKQNEPEIPTKPISIYEEANVSLSQFKDFHDYFQPPLFGTTTSSGTTIIKPINDQNQLYQDVVIIKKPKKVKQLTIINN